jgi:hypothetical protein
MSYSSVEEDAAVVEEGDDVDVEDRDGDSEARSSD